MYIYKSNRLVALDAKNGTKYMFGRNSKRCKYESVDMKITNKCNHNCSFCSEDSNLNGKHANINTIYNFVNTYCKPYTEIAIGGGNPLEHPQLEEILKMLYENGNPLALTVHIEDLPKVEPYLKYLKALGVSYTIETNKCNKILNEFKQKHDIQINVHIIPDLMPLDSILAIDHNRLTLLGFKDQGRGRQCWNDNTEFIIQNRLNIKSNMYKIFNKFDLVTADFLACLSYGLPHGHSVEGIHSVFFDAVENVIYNSSSDKIPVQDYEIDPSEQIPKKQSFMRSNTFETSSSTLSAFVFDKYFEMKQTADDFEDMFNSNEPLKQTYNINSIGRYEHTVFNTRFSKFVLILANIGQIERHSLRTKLLDYMLELNKNYSYILDKVLIDDLYNGDEPLYGVLPDDEPLPYEEYLKYGVKTTYSIKEFIENNHLVWEQAPDCCEFYAEDIDNERVQWDVNIITGVIKFSKEYPDFIANKKLWKVCKISII
jgi:hypothetical protein